MTRFYDQAGALNQLLEYRPLVELDKKIEQLFERFRGRPLLDRVFYAASESANHSAIWLLTTFALAAAGKHSFRRAALVAIALGVESAFVNGFVKSFFKRTRPEFEGSRPHRLRTPLTSSFPSGHATSATVATLLLLSTIDKTWAKWALVILAITVALSRIHVKIHHGTDVIFGLLFGVIFGVVAKRIVNEFE